MERSVRLKLI